MKKKEGFSMKYIWVINFKLLIDPTIFEQCVTAIVFVLFEINDFNSSSDVNSTILAPGIVKDFSYLFRCFECSNTSFFPKLELGKRSILRSPKIF